MKQKLKDESNPMPIHEIGRGGGMISSMVV